MSSLKTIQLLTRYKLWANEIVFSMMKALPHDELIKKRETRFGNMIHTLNHVYVIDAVFQAHLQGRAHGYKSRNTSTHPPLAELWPAVQALDHFGIPIMLKIYLSSIWMKS